MTAALSPSLGGVAVGAPSSAASPNARRSKTARRHQRTDSTNANASPEDVPESKGAWLPAAVFIFLSHVLVGAYVLEYVRWSLLGTGDSPGALYRVSGRMVALTALGAWLNLLGITAGYHRLWSHNSYSASFGLRVFLAIIGLCSFQGSARWWVLKHRLHHRFTDTTSDPYDSTRGLWYCHIGWLFEAPPYIDKVKLIDMKDLDQDAVVVFQKRYLLHGYVLFGLILPGLVGVYTDGSFLVGALWIGFIGRFISWHCIWTINSLSHWHGIREFSRASSAVYVAIVNLVQNGEGHHSFHHNFPQDYRHGHRWYEWDPTKFCIELWSLAGWAFDLRTTDPNAIKQAQAIVLEEEAREARAKARWPKDDDELPVWTVDEFEQEAERAKGKRVLLRLYSSVLDVSTFHTHPGGSALLRAHHGQDVTAAFEGEVNLHTAAAATQANWFKVATIRDDQPNTAQLA